MTTEIQTSTPSSRRHTRVDTPRTPNRSGVDFGKWIRRGLAMFALLSAGTLSYLAYANGWFDFSQVEAEIPTAVVKTMTIPDIVVEQGTIESQKTTKGKCEAEGYEFKIIKISPEGSLVKKGEVVVELDSSQAIKDITEQELEVQEAESDVQEADQQVKVQENENQTNIRQAKQEFEFAKIDLNKYEKGDFEVNKSDHEAQISEAQEKVDEARRAYENMRALVKKGFRQVEQLREAEQVVKSAELRLKQNKQKYRILLEFEHVKSLAEFKSKLEEADFKLKAAEETAKAKLAQANDNLQYRKRRLKRRVERLERYQKNLKKFKILAPQDGTVAYPTEQHWRAEEIREGAIVYQNATVFTLPNMLKMQVRVGIHESLISKIKPGLPATIKVDAFSGLPLKGKITKVAPLAEQSMFTATKTYTVIVHIDEFPEDMALKPGMTAQVEILAGRYPNVLAVPVQAVATNSGKRFVYVRKGREFELTEVEVGHSNVSFVEITTGLEEGAEVALDAFLRSIEDFGDIQPEEVLAEADSDEPFDPATVEAPKVESDEESDGKAEEEASEVGKTSSESSTKPETEADDDSTKSSKENGTEDPLKSEDSSKKQSDEENTEPNSPADDASNETSKNGESKDDLPQEKTDSPNDNDEEEKEESKDTEKASSGLEAPVINGPTESEPSEVDSVSGADNE